MLRKRTPLALTSLLAVALAALGQAPVAAVEAAQPASPEATASEPADDEPADEEAAADEAPGAPASAEGESTDLEAADGEASDEAGDDGEASDEAGDDAEATAEQAPDDEPANGEPTDGEPTDDEPADDEPTDGEANEPPADGFPLRSSVSDIGTPTPAVIFTGSGWGHGVGMSQYGAYNMAKNGSDAAEILGHYYPGTEVSTDDRTDQRIRVNLHAQVASASIEAIDAPIEWRHCQPRAGTNETTDHRVTDCSLEDPPADDPDSLEFHEQPAGTTLRVCNWDGEEPGDDPVDPEDPDAPTDPVDPPAEEPADDIAGLKLVSGDDCNDLDAIVATTERPVLRAYHHGNLVRSRQNPGSTGRRYQYGWQDFHRKTFGIDVVQDVNTVERYLEGLAEALRSWGVSGPAALEAQAITGRTYALRAKGSPRGLREGTRRCSCDLVDTPSDQVFNGREPALADYGSYWVKAVRDTAGEVLRYDGQLAQTYYSSSHGGGRSEAIEDSWAYGNTPIPYLRSIADPYSMNESHPFRSWTSQADHATFAEYVSSGRPEPLVRVERVQILNRTEGGTPREIRVTGVTEDGDTDTFVFTHRANDSQTLRNKQVAGASFRVNLPTSGHPSAAGERLPSSQIQRIGFGPFTDDDGLTHEYSITWASLAGVAAGVTETEFNPGGDVTRGQMARFIYETFDIPAPTEDGEFSDVPATSTHAVPINALAEAGVAGGYLDGTFKPGENVTRDQMATFIARAAGLSTEVPDEDPFDDVPAGVTHAGAITSVAAAGITAGCDAGENHYCPREPVTRQQMATFLRRTATS